MDLETLDGHTNQKRPVVIPFLEVLLAVTHLTKQLVVRLQYRHSSARMFAFFPTRVCEDFV